MLHTYVTIHIAFVEPGDLPTNTLHLPHQAADLSLSLSDFGPQWDAADSGYFKQLRISSGA